MVKHPTEWHPGPILPCPSPALPLFQNPGTHPYPLQHGCAVLLHQYCVIYFAVYSRRQPGRRPGPGSGPAQPVGFSLHTAWLLPKAPTRAPAARQLLVVEFAFVIVRAVEEKWASIDYSYLSCFFPTPRPQGIFLSLTCCIHTHTHRGGQTSRLQGHTGPRSLENKTQSGRPADVCRCGRQRGLLPTDSMLFPLAASLQHIQRARTTHGGS